MPELGAGVRKAGANRACDGDAECGGSGEGCGQPPVLALVKLRH
jgi:hypothetical protein